LEREQFSASEAAAADAATTSKQHATAVLDETRRAIASAKLNPDEARRAFESISMNVSCMSAHE
jgi:hypothetical protein